jgi:hypothetical protein
VDGSLRVGHRDHPIRSTGELDRFRERAMASGVEDGVDPLRDRPDSRRQAGAVSHRRRTQGSQVVVVRLAGGANHGRAALACELDRERTHSTCSRMNQQRL